MEYERKYKAALKWMQSLYSGLHGATKEEAEKYFPELKDSEDERIVKCLLNYFNHVRYNGLDLKGTDVDEVIAWLGKQGKEVTNINGEDYGIDGLYHMTRGEEIIKEAELCASANTQIIGDWGEHYLGFIHGAEWADAHPQWISVEDELPPMRDEDGMSDKVLTHCKGGGIFMNRYDYRGNAWGNPLAFNVTHWMPMPEAPSSSEFPNNHIIDANKKVDRVIGTADHIKTALDVLNKKGGENENP